MKLKYLLVDLESLRQNLCKSNLHIAKNVKDSDEISELIESSIDYINGSIQESYSWIKCKIDDADKYSKSAPYYRGPVPINMNDVVLCSSTIKDLNNYIVTLSEIKSKSDKYDAYITVKNDRIKPSKKFLAFITEVHDSLEIARDLMQEIIDVKTEEELKKNEEIVSDGESGSSGTDDEVVERGSTEPTKPTEVDTEGLPEIQEGKSATE